MSSARSRVLLAAMLTGLAVLATGPGLAAPVAPHRPAHASAPDASDSAARAVDDEVERLDRDLLEILGMYRWRTARWGVLVVSMDQGDTLFAHNPDSLLAPASNLKLLTTIGALEQLGPDYHFRTYLVSDGSIRNGVLDGDLVLYGTGDPGISDRFYPSRSWVFERLADQLRAAGIHTVTGDLVADASFLPGPLRPEGWDPADLNDHFAPAISALSFNENVVSFRLEAAERAGLPPVVHTLPAHAGLLVENRAVTVESGTRPGVSITREDPLDPFLVQGRIRRGGPDVWRQMTVSVPARFAGSVFRAVLEEQGVAVMGDLRVTDLPAASAVGRPRVTAPAVEGRPRTRILATHVSPPLLDYLAVVNKRSNNLFAELVFRVMGRDRDGVGTPEAGARAVADALAALDVPTAGLRQLDGSGLSEGNRVSPGIFVDLFRAESASRRWWDFWETLPEAGRRRELARMYRTPAAGNLRAKTGTIARVSALSGVVRSAQGERLAFSILVNGTPSTSGAKRVENAIGARLASFSRGSSLPVRSAQLPPPPPSATGGPVRHRIQPGDNLTGIAHRYGVSVADLLQANPGTEAERIRAGGTLIIPAAPALGSGPETPRR